MSNLATALALILAVETPNLDCRAVGDTHLPVSRRAYGRFQIRRTVLDDLNAWDNGTKLVWTKDDSMNPKLDVLMAWRWLWMRCGKVATVSSYLRTWNGGRSGRNSAQAWGYYRRAKSVAVMRPDHFKACRSIVNQMGIH